MALALEKAGLTFADIKPVYLQPPDARAALQSGTVDAWAIWDPFLAIGETAHPARHLPIGDAGADQNTFMLANRDFTHAHPEVVAAINGEIAAAARYAAAHKDEAATLFAAATNVPMAAQRLDVARTLFAVTPVTATIARQQQNVADRFARINLIPAPVTVADIVWPWTPGG